MRCGWNSSTRWLPRAERRYREKFTFSESASSYDRCHHGDDSMKRRGFLKHATQTLLAVPALGAFEKLAVAEPFSKPKSEPQAAKTSSLSLNVRDYGAKGDGTTKDTTAIQQTIDRCAVLGGGEVLIPAGNYLTGALQLRSHTLLRLAADAVLTGTGNMDDYPVTQVRWEGRWIAGLHTALIYACLMRLIRALSGRARLLATMRLAGGRGLRRRFGIRR